MKEVMVLVVIVMVVVVMTMVVMTVLVRMAMTVPATTYKYTALPPKHYQLGLRRVVFSKHRQRRRHRGNRQRCH